MTDRSNTRPVYVTEDACATLASFLTTAAERFEENANIARDSRGSYRLLFERFDRQAKQARTLAKQFEETFERANRTLIFIDPNN